jgi:hypothetical protein
VKMAQVALAWVLKNPIVSTPIVGATKSHHLPEAIAALDIHLTDDEITSLEEPYTPHGPSCSDGHVCRLSNIALVMRRACPQRWSGPRELPRSSAHLGPDRADSSDR